MTLGHAVRGPRKAGLGGGSADQIDDHAIADQRLSFPVRGDEREQAVLANRPGEFHPQARGGTDGTVQADQATRDFAGGSLGRQPWAACETVSNLGAWRSLVRAGDRAERRERGRSEVRGFTGFVLPRHKTVSSGGRSGGGAPHKAHPVGPARTISNG
jgi:hypothetical protein